MLLQCVSWIGQIYRLWGAQMSKVLFYISLAGVFLTFISDSEARAGDKVGLYGVHMRPYGHDAETYTRPSWGGGIYGVLPMDSLSAILAAVIGVDFVFLQNEALTVPALVPLIVRQRASGRMRSLYRSDPGVLAFWSNPGGVRVGRCRPLRRRRTPGVPVPRPLRRAPRLRRRTRGLSRARPGGTPLVRAPPAVSVARRILHTA